MCQTLDYSGSTVNDDNTSVTSSNIHAELLGSSKKGQSSSDSEHGLSCNIPLDKEKRKHDKDRVSVFYTHLNHIKQCGKILLTTFYIIETRL